MAYIRIKRFKRKKGGRMEYAYFVENRWKKRVKSGKKGARQRVKGYIGRVFRVDRVAREGFFESYKIEDVSGYLKKDVRGIVDDLVRLELVNHGFNEQKGLLVNGELTFDIRNYGFFVNRKAKNIVLVINEGFLCKKTLRRLVYGRFLGDEKEVGLKLAKAFVEAGLNVPKEIFVGVFEKVISRVDY